MKLNIKIIMKVSSMTIETSLEKKKTFATKTFQNYQFLRI